MKNNPPSMTLEGPIIPADALELSTERAILDPTRLTLFKRTEGEINGFDKRRMPPDAFATTRIGKVLKGMG